MEKLLEDLEVWGHALANSIMVFNNLIATLREEIRRAKITQKMEGETDGKASETNNDR